MNAHPRGYYKELVFPTDASAASFVQGVKSDPWFRSEQVRLVRDRYMVHAHAYHREAIDEVKREADRRGGIVYRSNPVVLSNVQIAVLAAGAVAGAVTGFLWWKSQQPAPLTAQLPPAQPVTMPGTYAPGSPGSWTS